MFLRNIEKNYIGPISFEGFNFTLPPGVSLVYDKFGEMLLTTIYKPRGTIQEKQKDGTIKQTGAPLPPVIAAKQEDWTGQYAQVTKFKVDASRLPNRSYILDLAEERGVEKELIVKARTNDTVTNEEIISMINDVPIPEEIRIPPHKPLEEKEQHES